MTRMMITWGIVALAVMPARVVQAEAVSFRNEVMAVLSKAGCNQGACHGNQNGKNGFKLSLRGQDPAFDLDVLRHGMFGRRVNPLRPEESLVLLKATATAPHEGGKRFTSDSPEYAILARWIAQGMPADPTTAPVLQRIEVSPREQVLFDPADRVQLRVTAFFSDGTRRDVTGLAVYETSNQVAAVTPSGEAVREQQGETAILACYLDGQATVQLAFLPARSGFHWQDVREANYIDRHVFAKLRTIRVQPSAVCSDSVFLRRAYLD